MLRSVLCFGLLTVMMTTAVVADCRSVHRYDRVVLYGTSEDPDVLLWDNRVRMRDYEDGSFDEMNMLLPHAHLLPPGTRAVVQLCISNYVEPSYLKSPTDAVGVLIVTGPLRGHYGWVVASDIRAILHTLPKDGPGE